MYHPVSKEKLTEIVEGSLKSKVKSVRLKFQNISEKEQLNLLSDYITSLIKHYDKLTKIIDIQCYYFNASMEHHLGHGLSLGGIRSRLNLSEKILKEKFLTKSRWEHDELEAKKTLRNSYVNLTILKNILRVK